MTAKSQITSNKSQGNPNSQARNKSALTRPLASALQLPPSAFVLLLAATLLFTGCSTRITKANFDRIQPGMTRAEVEAILGPAHQSYQTVLSWKTNHEKTVITVVLDDQGRVDSKNADGM